MADKVAATYHPYESRTYPCTVCEKEWANADAARTCCDLKWLGYD